VFVRVQVPDQRQRIDQQRVLTKWDFEKIRKLKAKVSESPGGRGACPKTQAGISPPSLP
jgi:hypothetical protein